MALCHQLVDHHGTVLSALGTMALAKNLICYYKDPGFPWHSVYHEGADSAAAYRGTRKSLCLIITNHDFFFSLLDAVKQKKKPRQIEIHLGFAFIVFYYKEMLKIYLTSARICASMNLPWWCIDVVWVRLWLKDIDRFKALYLTQLVANNFQNFFRLLISIWGLVQGLSGYGWGYDALHSALKLI